MFSEKQKSSKEDLSKEQNKIAQGTSYNGDITSQGSFRARTSRALLKVISR